MKVVLELQDQPSNVKRITVRHDIVIGRGSDCNLRLSAPQVSRRHCFLRVGRDSVSVTDLDSSNGTFIDGIRITAGQRCDVADGAQLALGPIRFVIHIRSETVSVDIAKSKMTAGVKNESKSAETWRESVPRRTIAKDGSTVGDISRVKDSDAPMDYNMEQGGEAAGPQDSTAKSLDRPVLDASFATLISPAPDPMDSRLEIIDFGRRLSNESLSGDESCAVPQDDVFGNFEPMNDVDPQWESAIVDSSDSPDNQDVLSIVDGSDVESDCDRELTSDAVLANGYAADDLGLWNGGSTDTVCLPPIAGAAVPGQPLVVVNEFLNVISLGEVAAEPVQNSEDETDPGVQDFLRGFE